MHFYAFFVIYLKKAGMKNIAEIMREIISARAEMRELTRNA